MSKDPLPYLLTVSQQSRSGEKPFLVQVWALPTLSSSLGLLVKAASMLSSGKSTSTTQSRRLSPWGSKVPPAL